MNFLDMGVRKRGRMLVVVGRVAAGVRTEMEKRVLAQEALVVAT
jgi:hypothetical protein